MILSELERGLDDTRIHWDFDSPMLEFEGLTANGQGTMFKFSGISTFELRINNSILAPTPN